MDAAEVTQALEIAGTIKSTQCWAVQPAVAKSGEGLEDGFSWLCAHMAPF